MIIEPNIKANFDKRMNTLENNEGVSELAKEKEKILEDVQKLQEENKELREENKEKKEKIAASERKTTGKKGGE